MFVHDSTAELWSDATRKRFQSTRGGRSPDRTEQEAQVLSLVERRLSRGHGLAEERGAAGVPKLNLNLVIMRHQAHSVTS